MISRTLKFIGRAARKPPRYVVARGWGELRREAQQAVLWAGANGYGPMADHRALPSPHERVLESTAREALQLGRWGEAAEAARADRGWQEEIERRCATALRREVELFGDGRVAAGIPPRWHEDLCSGYGWPRASYRRIDYVNLGRASDVKVAWELSRLRHAVALAQAAAVLRSQQALSALQADLADWRLENPVGRSVNWTCAMEVALRAVNLICVDGILLGGGCTRDRAALVGSLYQHGWFLARNLEISDVNGNHFLADAVGLTWLGRYFAGVGEGERWYRRGIAMARAAARDQVLADGLDHEGSLPYHVLVLELMLLARHAAEKDLREVDPPLRAMLAAASSFTAPNGRVPLIGDDDGGRALALGDGEALDARRVLAFGAVLLGSEESRGPILRRHLSDAHWLLGPASRVAPRARAEAGSGAPKVLAEGGLAILGGGDDHVVVDVGPIGFRGRGGHGHADAMSFEATLGGQLAVRDSGTATYTGDPALRNRLRAADAHSTVILDGLSYTELGGPDRLWQMTGDHPPRVLAASADRLGGQELVAEQELPARRGPARWTRVLQWRTGRLTVSDTVSAPPGTTARWSLQLPLEAHIEGTSIATDAHVYRCEAPAARAPSLEECEWSPRYGSVRKAVRAILELEVSTVPLSVRWTIESR